LDVISFLCQLGHICHVVLQESCVKLCCTHDCWVAGIGEEDCGRVTSSFDFQMDLQRAIEMSRLQFLAETSRALALGLPEG